MSKFATTYKPAVVGAYIRTIIDTRLTIYGTMHTSGPLLEAQVTSYYATVYINVVATKYKLYYDYKKHESYINTQYTIQYYY